MDEGWQNPGRPSQTHHSSLYSSRSLEGGLSSARNFSDFKVPIPRLQRPTPVKTPAPSERQRVSHACEPCRRRKSKCDGAQPICSRCKDHELTCSYADGKREKLKRNAKSLATKVMLYESLLVDLLPSLEPTKQQAVRNTLAENKSLFEADAAASAEGTASGDDGNEEDFQSTSSPGFQELTPQDIMDCVRPSGFLGRSSIVRWMEEASRRMAVTNLDANVSRLSFRHRQMLLSMNRAKPPEDFHRLLMEGCDYFVNHLDVSDFGVFGENVDAFQLPPRETADVLLHAYFSTVHPFFPVLSQHDFVAQYRLYYETKHPPSSGIYWIAILNLVFALGALYGYSCQATFVGGEQEHVLYFLRSRILSQEPTQMVEFPTVDHVQCATIGGIYLFASNQMNRAWSAVALAVRYAQARALHLVHSTPDGLDPLREHQVRLWQSICSLEQMLCVWTGRPPAIRSTNGPVPKSIEPRPSSQSSSRAGSQHPTPVPDGAQSFISPSRSASTASFYLDGITMEVLEELYSPGMVSLDWTNVQRLVGDLNAKLNRWHSSLPSYLKLPLGQLDLSPYIQRERSYLAFRFCSTRMLINWPCLCKTRNAGPPPASRSNVSKNFDAEAVEQCREAARDLLRILPDNGTVSAVYDSTPWWCLLHFIVQAGVILGLEILTEVAHMLPLEKDQLVAESVKAIRWLRALSENSIPAKRAWYALSRLLQLALASAGKDMAILTPYIPPDTSLPSSFASDRPIFLGQHPGYL